MLADFSDDAVRLFCGDRHEVTDGRGEEFPVLSKTQSSGPNRFFVNN